MVKFGLLAEIYVEMIKYNIIEYNIINKIQIRLIGLNKI